MLCLHFVQILSDFEELKQNLVDGKTEVCCFDNHNIEMDSSIFEDNGDPVTAAIKNICKCQVNESCTVVMLHIVERVTEILPQLVAI